MFKFKDLSKEDLLRAFDILDKKGKAGIAIPYFFHPGGSVKFFISKEFIENDYHDHFQKTIKAIVEDAEEHFVEEIRNILTKDGEILYGFENAC